MSISYYYEYKDLLLIYICSCNHICRWCSSESILLSVGGTLFCSPSLSKTKWELSLFATTRLITDINSIVTIVVVGIIIDKLVFVFVSGGRCMKDHDTLYQISDTIITNPKPPNLLQTQVLRVRQVNEPCIRLTQENSIESSIQTSLPYIPN